MSKKTAKIVDARALTIVCEACEEPCEDSYGSTMITDESKTVTCRYCDTVYEVPRQAFYAVFKAKLKEASEIVA